MTDKQQAGLLEALAGKRQGQIVAAILNNLDTVTESINKMETDTDSASRELETALDTVDVKWGQVKETGVGIAQNLFKRDDMKTFLDVIVKPFMNALDKITAKLGLFKTTAIGAFAFFNKGRSKERFCPSWW